MARSLCDKNMKPPLLSIEKVQQINSNPQNEDENQYASSLPQNKMEQNRTEKTEKNLGLKKLGAKIKYCLFYNMETIFLIIGILSC
jgi:hypothetical protein